jgi:hypothetical protein
VELSDDSTEGLRRVLELHDAVAVRAKQAIACWSVVGERLGLVKDVRVLIAKMAWKEAWLWSRAAGIPEGEVLQ